MDKKKYCHNLDKFSELWNDWFSSAYSDGSCIGGDAVLQKATKLYDFMNSNKDFVDKMLSLTHGFKLNKHNGLFYWNNFISAYNTYIQDPASLCCSFSEFISNLSEFLVAGGCSFLLHKGEPCPNYSC